MWPLYKGLRFSCIAKAAWRTKIHFFYNVNPVMLFMLSVSTKVVEWENAICICQQGMLTLSNTWFRPFYGLASAQIVETSFSELTVPCLDLSPCCLTRYFLGFAFDSCVLLQGSCFTKGGCYSTSDASIVDTCFYLWTFDHFRIAAFDYGCFSVCVTAAAKIAYPKKILMFFSKFIQFLDHLVL